MGPNDMRKRTKAPAHMRAAACMPIEYSRIPNGVATRTAAPSVISAYINTVVGLAVSWRPVCPRIALVITARIMVGIAPAVSAWIAADLGMLVPRTLAPNRKSPIGTHEYPT